jgi:3-deoxy-manno-octulosonate cytidylyltransferase (CMP-KDO synthetase)
MIEKDKRKKRVLGVIPCHLESQRLPRKALREIAGKPMIHWVQRAASQTPLLHEVLVATDSREIEDYCREAGIPVLLTGTHPSGTDRLHEVMSRVEADIYVNIQGDEPLLLKEHFELLVPPVTSGDCQISTLKVSMDWKSAQDPNKVKVVTDKEGGALYFSRHPIPFLRDKRDAVVYYKHIGIYAYHRNALELFYSLPQSPLELAERLEQLRFLENGIPIHVVETVHDTIGVDTEEDLRQVEAILSVGGRNPG